jgi:hypothetical protein
MVENPYEAEAGCGDGTAAVFFREGFAREALTPAGVSLSQENSAKLSLWRRGTILRFSFFKRLQLRFPSTQVKGFHMPDLEQAIRERAYQLWLADGCPIGNAEVHWLSAQRQVLASSLGSFARVTVSEDAPVQKLKRKHRGKQGRRAA